MENKVLDENLTYIAKYNKELTNKILMTDIGKSNLELSKTNSGEYNLVLNNIELHSQNGALDEVQTIANSFENNKDNLIIIYGLGLGYLPDAISKKCYMGKIVIYEPNLEIIKFVLSIAQIDALYNNNVFLVSDSKEFSNILKNISSKDTNLSIAFLNSYKNLFYQDILSTFQNAQNIISESVGNANTYIRKMPFASLNTFSNLQKLISSPLIDELKDVYKDKTALIMCAGPSLEKNINFIKNNQNKFVSFALNPTLKLLKKHSITPDFVVNIDVIDNFKQFENIDLSNSYFITDIYTHHKICALPSNKHFFYISNDNFFNRWVRNGLKIKNDFKNLGTSSYTAFQSAIYMGFSKIIFIGQDLSYKDGKCYCSESQYNSIECIFNKEKNKYEIIASDFEKFKESYKTKGMDDKKADIGAKNFLKKLNQNIRTTKDCNGNLIPTKADYLVFINIFEKCAKEIKNIELINSSNGANIECFDNISLDKALSESIEIQKINLSQYTSKYDFKNFKKEIDTLENNLKNTYEILKNFLEISNKLIGEIEVKKTLTNNILKLIEKYKNALNKLINEFKNEDINTLLSVFVYDIYELLQSNYFSDEKMLLNSLKKIVPAFKRMFSYADKYLEKLHNCQSVILE